MAKNKRDQTGKKRKKEGGRNNPEKLTEHHRKPRSKGGKRTPRNISRVTRKQHEAFTTLFDNKDVEEITDDLNEKWIDPDYVVIAVKKKWLKT